SSAMICRAVFSTPSRSTNVWSGRACWPRPAAVTTALRVFMRAVPPPHVGPPAFRPAARLMVRRGQELTQATEDGPVAMERIARSFLEMGMQENQPRMKHGSNTDQKSGPALLIRVSSVAHA